MARQVLPLVGAVAGFAVGGPTGAQIGFALGSLVGNAVDPIEMQGRKLGDAPTQVAAEGGARAIVYGKGCIRATVVLERGGRRVIRQRDRSGGKGGGPTTINERALWTFAIGLGEPVAAILRIWENEKLVYDVTPESVIAEDSASFAERFRFYDGSETQLPDPALEALHGVGNTPYYRGTAYLVFPQYDLTDFGETVPTYRVEVASEATMGDGLNSWDPDQTTPGVVYTNSDKTAEAGLVSAPARRGAQADQFRSTGKWYFEARINEPGLITGGSDVGLAYEGWNGEEEVGGTGTGAGWSLVFNGSSYHNGTPGSSVPAPGADGVARFAFDADSGNLWVGTTVDWAGGGSPELGTVPTFTGVTGPISPAFSSGDTTSIVRVTLAMTLADFASPVPTGFAPWYTQPTSVGDPVPLDGVIAALHERCGSTEYDVSELTEMISGVVIESTVTAAEAINSIIGSHFADPSDYDGQIHYIKRGKPVVLTLTEDDLIDEPDEAQRNNAIEYPKKVHFLGQRADLAYASSKSTSARYSDDARVVGEITIGSPETYDEPTAPAEVAVKLHKVLWTEAEGEREWMVPDNYLGLVPTDNVGLSYRGELVRCRILNIEDTPGQRKLRMIRDRQSAYTANLTEIPNPPAPTPPQSSVVAPTVMAFIDTSALTDSADTLHYLVALSGANDNWAGAVLQQQLGGSFSSIDSTTLNSIMGVLQSTVTDAAPWYTDTTNTVVVRLYTDDELESRTDAEFLSNGGAFFLSWEDSGTTQWEIMQFRDAVQDSNGDWILSHLMRGRKNTETAEHPPGATFVWIDPAILREPAQTSWLNTVLTHRAVSNGQSPELAPIQNNEYVGNSQREWPVADILLSRPTADSVEAEAIPRHRFGTSMNPIRSINWDGYRWNVTDGVNTINRDGTSETETFDTTGWGSPVTVTVAQLNRLTGAGPAVSEDIV